MRTLDYRALLHRFFLLAIFAALSACQGESESAPDPERDEPLNSAAHPAQPDYEFAEKFFNWTDLTTRYLHSESHQRGDLVLFNVAKLGDYKYWLKAWPMRFGVEIYYYFRLKHPVDYPGFPSYVIRTIPEDYHSTNASSADPIENLKYEIWNRNRFTGTEAIIFCDGVNNPETGDLVESTDKTLLAIILSTAMMKSLPVGSSGKKVHFPAYLQFVHNRNGSAGGVFHLQEHTAVDEMVHNIAMAYNHGVTKLNIYTHSNGAVTSHAAFGAFVDNFNRLAVVNRAGTNPMTINFLHFQAAPGGKSDFFFLAKKDRTVKSFETNRDYGVNWTVDYYFNSEDELTWRNWSSVGAVRVAPAVAVWNRTSADPTIKMHIWHSRKNRFGLPTWVGPNHSKHSSIWYYASKKVEGDWWSLILEGSWFTAQQAFDREWHDRGAPAPYDALYENGAEPVPTLTLGQSGE